MSELNVDGARRGTRWGTSRRALIERCPRPSSRRSTGFALGGGCELALACDFRYARRQREARPAGDEPRHHPRVREARSVSHACRDRRRERALFTGDVIGAEEALRLGLVNEIADPVLERALQTARELAAKSAVALALAKRLVNMSPFSLAVEAKEFGELFGSADAKEGLAAFVEKREPRFADI